MAKVTFQVGDLRVALPLSLDDIDWFARTRAQRVGSRKDTSRSLSATFDLAMLMEASFMLGAEAPRSVAVVADAGSFDIGAAAGLCALAKALRRTEVSQPALFETGWDAVFNGAVIASPKDRAPERDVAWEFLSAAACATFADDVRMNRSTGVDVTGRFRNVRCGVECKALHSSNPNRQVDRIVEGVKQLEADPGVDRGFVAVNVTNCVDQQSFSKSLSGKDETFPAMSDAVAVLATELRSAAAVVATPHALRRVSWDKRGRPRRKCRGVIFVAQTVALAGGRVDVYTAQFSSMLGGPSDPWDRDFVGQYQKGLCGELVPMRWMQRSE